MDKVLIKPDKAIKVSQDVLNVLDNATGTPTSEMIDLVKDKDFNLAYLRDEFGHLISGLSFSLDNRIFIGITPSPIDIYFGIAYTFLVKNNRILEEIKKQKEDPNLQCVLLADNKFNSFLQYRISCIIMLHSTLEAFINSIVPDTSYSYPKVVKEHGQKITKHLSKEEVERLNFSEKFKDVVKHITQLDFATTNQNLYISINKLNNLRCDLIHLKTMKDGKKENHIQVYVQIIKADLDKYTADVKAYINTIRPGTIQFTNKELS
ncbi:hypothetical protein [uncultured Pontibacter sp.]|uniref:hypothetical protein n=1 Tax=uncultured Pontibacter sp. TaxID=453356 RepID=UPI00260D5E07|nr:hypothetical protein [uncultured Pontibacter sp.]